MLGGFRKRPAIFELDRETPDQHTRRGELDHAVNPERREDDAIRHHTRGNGDHRLDCHPRNREPLQPERLRNQFRTIWIATTGALRSGRTAIGSEHRLRGFPLKGFGEGRIRRGMLVHKFSEAFRERHARRVLGAQLPAMRRRSLTSTNR